MSDAATITDTYLRRRRYLVALDRPAQIQLCEDACRRCRMSFGLPTDSRCHSNADPGESWCVALDQLIAERMGEA